MFTAMEVVTTKDAAALAGVTVRQWHYIATKYGLEPLARADGPRGAMVWTIGHVEQVRALIEERAA